MLPAVDPLPIQTVAGPFAAEAFLVARVLFGGTLAFTGLNHFFDLEGMAGYAAAKGIPAPTLAVALSGLLLALGGLGVAVGAFPALAAGTLALVLLVITPTMHDFWAAPEDQRDDEMTSFLKNVALLGGALALVGVAGADWPYAVGIGLV